jgi:hypothetical protein
MARTLYDQGPVRDLMIEAAAQAEYPATPSDFVAWFAEHYPRVKATTVKLHVKGLTVNDRSRHHFHSLVRRAPLFTKNADGSLSPLEGPAVDEIEIDKAEEDAENAEAPRLEFALEAFLEEFLLSNWEGIDWGRPLELWESENGELGHQLATPVGRLDFLCRDTTTNTLVVIELMRGRSSDRVVGQAARYVGWVRAHLAHENQLVEGLIVAHEQDLQMAYAVSAVPDLSVLTYNVDFSLSAPEQPTIAGPDSSRRPAGDTSGSVPRP